MTVRSAKLVTGEGIEIRGVSILERAADGPRAELLSYDECFLRCRTDLQDLLADKLEVTQVTIRRPTLHATRRPDGSWSAAKLLPLPKLSKRPPQVTIESGIVEIFDPTKNPTSTLTFRDINLTLTPTTGEDRKLQATLSGDYFRQATVEGVVDPHRPGFALVRQDRGPGHLPRAARRPARRPGGETRHVGDGARAGRPPASASPTTRRRQRPGSSTSPARSPTAASTIRGCRIP